MKIIERARKALLLHNLVGHPLMALLEVAGWYRAANWIHDYTLPKDLRE